MRGRGLLRHGTFEEALTTSCCKGLFVLLRLVADRWALSSYDSSSRTSVSFLQQFPDILSGNSPGCLANDSLSLPHGCPDNVLEGFR